MSEKTPIVSRFRDDFLEGSKTIYNYVPNTMHNYLFYSQIVGIQNIGPNYYNELALAKEYLIQYTMEGEGNIEIEKESFTVRKGSLLIIPNYYHHIFRPIKDKNWKIAFVHIFENPTVVDIFKRIYLKHRFILEDIPQELVLPHINAIIDLLSESVSDTEFKVSEQIYGLLMKICERSDSFEKDAVDTELASVLHFLKQNYNTNIRISDILPHSNYSKNHLERLFRSRMNMTMQEYIYHLRLTRAQELIVGTNLYYKQIAEMVGLSDYRALIYLFKKTIGITPSEYRKQALAAQKKKSEQPS